MRITQLSPMTLLSAFPYAYRFQHEFDGNRLVDPFNGAALAVRKKRGVNVTPSGLRGSRYTSLTQAILRHASSTNLA